MGGLVGTAVVLGIQLLYAGESVLYEEIHTICDNHVYIEAQINSLQKRIDDMYVFAGVVVTLLLAINVGVYVRAANEIDEYIRINFEKRKEEVAEIIETIRQLLVNLENEVQYREKRHKKRSKL